jgi:hypothetical protein
MDAQTYVDLRLIVGCIGGGIGIVGFIALMIHDHLKR